MRYYSYFCEKKECLLNPTVKIILYKNTFALFQSYIRSRNYGRFKICVPIFDTHKTRYFPLTLVKEPTLCEQYYTPIINCPVSKGVPYRKKKNFIFTSMHSDSPSKYRKLRNVAKLFLDLCG